MLKATLTALSFAIVATSASADHTRHGVETWRTVDRGYRVENGLVYDRICEHYSNRDSYCWVEVSHRQPHHHHPRPAHNHGRVDAGTLMFGIILGTIIGGNH